MTEHCYACGHELGITKLSRAMAKAGYTFTTFATAMGMSRGALGNWACKGRLPDEKHRLRIYELLPSIGHYDLEHPFFDDPNDTRKWKEQP